MAVGKKSGYEKSVLLAEMTVEGPISSLVIQARPVKSSFDIVLAR